LLAVEQNFPALVDSVHFDQWHAGLLSVREFRKGYSEDSYPD
jgi:hypothetical protein